MSYRGPYVDPVPMPYDNKGKAAQIYGIVAVVTSIACCPIVGLVLGILALTNAAASRRFLGFESGQASSGKVLGIVAIVLSALGMFATIAYTVITVLALLAELGETGGVTI